MANKKIQLGLLLNHKQMFSTIGNQFHQWLYTANDLIFGIFGQGHPITDQYDNLVTSFKKEINAARNLDDKHLSDTVSEQIKSKYSMRALNQYEEAILTLQSEIDKKAVPKMPSKTNLFLGKFFWFLLGVAGTILTTQLFFKPNKRYEATLTLKEQQAKESFPIYTRIINFSASYTVANFYELDTTVNVKETRLLDMPVSSDTSIVKVDTVHYSIPSFVIEPDARKDFLDDFFQIKKDKDKIAPDVWSKFQDVDLFLRDHPLPPMHGQQKIKWIGKETLDKWNKVLFALNNAATEKLNNPF